MTEEQIQKRIASAPAPFREHLLDLHKRGLLTDPKFLAAIVKARDRVIAEQKAELAKRNRKN
jgi:hypothetical protein